jgi:hypothetical protein
MHGLKNHKHLWILPLRGNLMSNLLKTTIEIITIISNLISSDNYQNNEETNNKLANWGNYKKGL